MFSEGDSTIDHDAESLSLVTDIQQTPAFNLGKHECVWKVKSKDYHNREKKEAAHRSLLLVVKGFDSTATKSDVLKKINTIRSAFRKEQRKVTASQRSGSGTDDIYVPKLWYYSELLFLIDQEECLGGTSNLGEGRVSEDEVRELNYYHWAIESSLKLLEPLPILPLQHLNLKILLNGKKNCPRGDQVLVNIGTNDWQQQKEEDHYDAFGKNVAQKLRLLNNEQRIYAQKIINDALFEAELGGLTRFATVNPGILYSSFHNTIGS
ncbi:uncharacterized protein LOC124366744 [Homalodisca vitripennis]|uniref:uncharacterized protein LOC124366744 n=1 Tax=Homalodisca vitripennis TaxID=197043 RepID=UPI001EEA8793|nr:uncharacterized protein LOC124366744 [Homalodisca vitripennis]